ncbi:hypothetical protein L249_1675 [Ophiocordyceps polyrhachis-furcata BCC 54312]|uniref:Glucose-methanol-choline oxidoreductase N-terminal domain-containing protein n=1 Tax=Ophiocordyceps polyrhachis-furcata BCC 54312 TaxID=1330021 RepID=A0A367KZK9_9HYPO|nr:hypothetical protein L249_1675 [Ophiocordyceps polyrhachis-furcata BCC 54312]
MPLYTKLPPEIVEVDIIIAGGGTAGCVVAARLADADPQLTILAVEAGPNNEVPTIQFPACFLSHIAPDSKTNRILLTKPAPSVANRPLVLVTGSVLGGGSSMNMMMYSRAQRSDWDSWNAPGWSADEMIPFLKKLETFHGEDPNGVHGHHGPIQVSLGTYGSKRMEDEFISASEEAGWPEVPDLSDLDSVNAVWRAKRSISPEGKRQDAATCYIHPRLKDGEHPNLHVVVETQVVRILMDKNKRAVGVETISNPRYQADSAGSGEPPRTVKARKLVIAASGACGTPPLLERSGVGEAKALERASVPVILDLPGVGSGYQDHQLVSYSYLNDMTVTETLDGFYSGRMGEWEQLMKENDKILGWNAQPLQAKVRPTDAEVAALGPDFQKAVSIRPTPEFPLFYSAELSEMVIEKSWDEEFKDCPDKPLVVFSVIAGFPGDPSLSTGDPCLAITVFTVYPFSRGHIHITGPGPDDALDFESGIFADARQLDIKMHMWIYKRQREIIRRMPMYRGEMAHCHPPFAAGSAAASIKLDGPLPADAPEIHYSAEDEVVLEKWLRENVLSTWHPLGTCKMLPREEGGVVDPGLGGLKIADLSIAPHNVAANTNNTALAIGERAADIFIKELACEPVEGRHIPLSSIKS